jgi:Uncharacterized protein conserved in bacteria
VPTPVDAKNVKIVDPFWTRYTELVREVMIPYQWEVMNDRVEGVAKSHAIANFKIAAGLEKGEFYGYRFQDSDVAKWLEAVAHSLSTRPDKRLEKLADETIELIRAAQLPDGYLNTYFTVARPGARWTNERDGHETYVAGHMIEAAVAYYRATGKRELLDVARRNADHIESVFGPQEGKKRGYPGHQLIEMALVELYEATLEERYLNLAKYFIEERGREPKFFALEAEAAGLDIGDDFPKDDPFKYTQSHAPVREQEAATGHAVRAMYLYSGMADVARLTGDQGLAEACRRLWKDVTRRQMAITGGLGQQEHWEGFSFDYDLPNDRSYNETCASIGLVFWASRMAKLELAGDYFDVAERALYNGVLSGVSLDGKKFFYVNPLESVPALAAGRKDTAHVASTRKGWFSCACCPPNLARLIASIGGYAYAVDEKGLIVHSYIGSEALVDIKGIKTKVVLEGGYPWTETVSIAIQPVRPTDFSLRLRKPGWCPDMAIVVNGELAPAEAADGYVAISRRWKEGDILTLRLPMPVRRVQALPEVRADAGKVALMRGPIVYCLEGRDNGSLLSDIALDPDPRLEARFEPDLLGGVVALYGRATRSAPRAARHDDDLYRDYEADLVPVRIKAVPYFAWDNRGENEMAVWIRQR